MTSKPKPLQHTAKTSTGKDSSEMRQAWIAEYIATGDRITAAAHAGYKRPARAARKLEYEMRDQVREAMETAYAAYAPAALNVIVQLMQTAESEQVRLKAAQDVLSRLTPNQTPTPEGPIDIKAMAAQLIQRVGYEIAHMLLPDLPVIVGSSSPDNGSASPHTPAPELPQPLS